jgi:hypothetical protein
VSDGQGGSPITPVVWLSHRVARDVRYAVRSKIMERKLPNAADEVLLREGAMVNNPLMQQLAGPSDPSSPKWARATTCAHRRRNAKSN